MRKVLILTSVLAMLGTGNALAFDASNGFGPSDQSDLPVPRFEMTDPVNLNQAPGHGIVFGAGKHVGWSAADGFGPTRHDDLTAPTFEVAGPVVPAGVRGRSSAQAPRGVIGRRVGWSAADGFGPSTHDLPAPRFEKAG